MQIDDDFRIADDQTIGSLRKIVGSFAPGYFIERVYLFGSRSRGEYSAGSDYDLCVVPGEGCRLLDLGGFLQDMEDALGCEVNVISRTGMSDRFLKTVEPDLRLVYEA